MDHEIQSLRLELKEWEKSFATNNEGRKAGREDIKQHPDIANKYKLYNKLRANEASQSKPQDVPGQEHKSKKHPARTTLLPVSTHTPQKNRSRHSQHSQPEPQITEQGPSPVQYTPIAHRKSIGPTPQKNGRVLGLFDLLTPSSSYHTPSKRQCLAPLPENVVGTPSRIATRLANQDDKDLATDAVVSPRRKRSRSPPSASKRTYLASFLTPSTRRFSSDVGNTPENTKPVSALRFDDTPAFLKRDSQSFAQRQHASSGAKDEDVEGSFSWSPVAVRVMRPKPVGRGLSALVKGLRELEESKLDEEMEMLREMEGGSGEGHQNQVKTVPKVCVQDSQALEMPLGPDGQSESDSEDLEALKGEGLGRNGKPLKVWKKKGQKRTTRRVTIKPNTAKWKPEPEWKGGKEVDSEDEVVAVEETQLVTDGQAGAAADEINGLPTDDEYLGAEFSDKDTRQDQKGPKEGKQKGRSKKSAGSPPKKEKKKRMVSATAHANFRALKIKNKQSKGKGRGRFGRRR
ncbi:MAG: hypothetical protein Q9218_001617 [Villophora microphyllina]